MELREGLPYIEPVYGKHAAPMGRDRSRVEAIEYMTNGRRVYPGFGKHRANRSIHIHHTQAWRVA
jgi:hypothetical protein